jgi:hypothetical protein
LDLGAVGAPGAGTFPFSLYDDHFQEKADPFLE